MSTLLNAVSVLRLFSPERRELSVTEVSRLLVMPKSSASRLLKAMLGQGLLAVVPGTQRYRVGTLFLEMARLYGRESTLMDFADAALSEICKKTQHTGYISILDGSDVLVLRVFEGTQALRVVTPLGSRAPAFATSTGRALLARLSDDAVRALHAGPLKPPSKNSPQTVEELLGALEQVRQTGWCEAIDEGIPGVGSISVSIADIESQEAAAFCVSFPANVVPLSERRIIASMLAREAKRIGAQLDDPFWRALKKPRVVAA